MKSKEEIFEWFKEKINNCYPCNVNNKIYWIYNKNISRKYKLSIISNEKIQLYFTETPFYIEDDKNKIIYLNYWKCLLYCVKYSSILSEYDILRYLRHIFQEHNLFTNYTISYFKIMDIPNASNEIILCNDII